jgi:hypothetical protein
MSRNWIGEGQHYRDANRKEAERLRALGYKLKSDAYGYKVSFKDEFVGAVGAAERNPKHWRHRDADLRMFFFQALLTAQKHESRGEEEKEGTTA